jgi:CBS domain containing-hemolysin-like protein
MFVVRLIGVLSLVVLNGFFAAAEFSLVAVRISRVRQLVDKGNIRARIVESLVGDLHRVVSGVQLGITLTSLALGALGESTLQIFSARCGLESWEPARRFLPTRSRLPPLLFFLPPCTWS